VENRGFIEEEMKTEGVIPGSKSFRAGESREGTRLEDSAVKNAIFGGGTRQSSDWGKWYARVLLRNRQKVSRRIRRSAGTVSEGGKKGVGEVLGANLREPHLGAGTERREIGKRGDNELRGRRRKTETVDVPHLYFSLT